MSCNAIFRCMARTSRETFGERTRTHGMTGTRTYRIWRHMLNRCYLPTIPCFDRYGGRGIIVCDRWLIFENFYKDMGRCPPDKSIDRYPNNDGHYEPTNCRWATYKEQSDNRRTTIRLTHNGQTKTLVEWAKIIGMPHRTLYFRYRANQPIERILIPKFQKEKLNHV